MGLYLRKAIFIMLEIIQNIFGTLLIMSAYTIFGYWLIQGIFISLIQYYIVQFNVDSKSVRDLIHSKHISNIFSTSSLENALSRKFKNTFKSITKLIGFFLTLVFSILIPAVAMLFVAIQEGSISMMIANLYGCIFVIIGCSVTIFWTRRLV